MKTTMKKSIAYLLAVLLVIQVVPAFADQYTATFIPNSVVFREKLEIMPEQEVSIMTVGMTNKLTVNDGYDQIVWSSDNENVATVDQDGLVEAVGAGKVKITVSAEGGHYNDSITFKVTGAAVSDNQENTDEKLVIIISGNKTKVEYDGQVHTNTYSIAANKEYDESKLTVSQNGLASGTDCRTYKDSLDAVYDGDAEIIISDGWLQIKPKTITVKADDVTVLNPNATPNYTASVTAGLIEGDELDLSQVEFKIEGNYILPMIEKGAIIGNYRVENVQGGVLTVASEQPLYNIAKIGNSFYRLKKTTIRAEKNISEYVKKLKDTGNQLKFTAADYWAEDYDFANQIITVNGKTYAHISRFGDNPAVDGYYEAKLDCVSAVKNKIGGSSGFIVPQEDRYPDKNETDSFHRDYIITLTAKIEDVTEQTLYNFLNVNGNYYRLQTTKIVARPVEEVVTKKEFGTVNSTKHPFACAEYDFSNVVLKINGKKYVYRENTNNLPDEYVSFFTVKLNNVNVPAARKLNKDDSWYNNEEGWQDGAHWDVPNETDAYHRDYDVTLYEGNIQEAPERKVTISSDWPEGRIAYPGAKITLTATAVGFEGNVRFQWQRSAGNDVWEDIPGENGVSYTYILNNDTAQYVWRVVAED